MVTTFKKELVVFTDPEIEELYVGALPAVGRYFTKPCEKITDGAFRVELEVPKGEVYCHVYFTEGTREHSPTAMLTGLSGNAQIGAGHWHTVSKIGTDVIVPVHFIDEPPCVSPLSDDTYSFRLTVTQPWVQGMTLEIYADGVCVADYPVAPVYLGAAFSYYEVVVPASALGQGDQYTFQVAGSDHIYYLSGQGQLSKQPDTMFSTARVLARKPTRARTAEVVYHIFPDRFYRGGEIETSRQLSEWGSEPDYFSFYGGNLPGITEKLDHLTTLGVTVLYLTPIFEAPSNHRYDCQDYRGIDPLLGQKADLHRLVEACHQRGIKVVLDIVLNHCGTEFWAFQDVLKHGEESPYRDWFLINKFPVEVKSVTLDYRCWWNNGNMPEFNLANEEVRAYLFDVCGQWVQEFAIDGWRIDVSAEMEISFLTELRQTLQSLRPDILLIGENWKDASLFLDGHETLSGVTNYLYWWKSWVPYFVEGRYPVSELATSLAEVYFTYSHEKLLDSWNVLSSHDVPRFISMLLDRRDIYPAVFLQTMLPGTPIVYYGEEIGMAGLHDPLNRACMNWEFAQEEQELLGWYQDLLRMYHQEPALQNGQLAILEADDELQMLAWSRQYGQERVLCVVNFSTEERNFDLRKVTGAEREWLDLLAHANAYDPVANTVTVPPKRGCLLKERMR